MTETFDDETRRITALNMAIKHTPAGNLSGIIARAATIERYLAKGEQPENANVGAAHR